MQPEKVKKRVVKHSTSHINDLGVDGWACERYVLKRLSKGPMRLSDLRYELFLYFGDIGDDVIEKLKLDKIIEIGWSQFLGEYAVRLLKKRKK